MVIWNIARARVHDISDFTKCNEKAQKKKSFFGTRILHFTMVKMPRRLCNRPMGLQLENRGNPLSSVPHRTRRVAWVRHVTTFHWVHVCATNQKDLKTQNIGGALPSARRPVYSKHKGLVVCTSEQNTECHNITAENLYISVPEQIDTEYDTAHEVFESMHIFLII